MPDFTEIVERSKSYIVSAESESRIFDIYKLYPSYEKDSYYGLWAKNQDKILMLNGTFDFQTPMEIALPAKENLQGVNHFFVTVPYAGHGVIFSDNSGNDQNIPCGMQIMAEFLENPDKTPNTSCTTNLLGPDFKGAESEADFYFGTDDLWENISIKRSASYEKITESMRIEMMKNRLKSIKFPNR